MSLRLLRIRPPMLCRANFGTARQKVEQSYPEDVDGYEKEEFDLAPRKNAYYYKYEIGKYARQGPVGLKKALELFQEMKSVARLTPSYKNFSPLLYGCAKAGYTKRAFELYEEWMKYEKKPNNSSITCLINSCAECPFPEYGLQRLEWFLTEVKVRFNHDLNLLQYNAAIKAYGKLGKLEEASKLVQQMIDNGLTPDICTFQSLLIGCASDKKSGSALALRVFKRLKMYDMTPDTITYRLLLRCIRDCGLGSKELIEETLNELPALTTVDQRLKYNKKRASKSDKKIKRDFVWSPLLVNLGESLKDAFKDPGAQDSGHDKTNVKKDAMRCDLTQTGSFRMKHSEFNPSNDKIRVKGSDEGIKGSKDCDNESLVTHEGAMKLPNLLSDDHLDLSYRIQGINLDELRTRYDRLLLFGGPHGFVEEMMKDGCKPDIKTLSLLLLCIESTKENFLDFFKMSDIFKIKRDVDFYDQLVYSVCRNFHNNHRLELALEFMEEMKKDNLRPTISTFEALALGCNRWKDAKKMIEDMADCKFVVSRTMLESFFNSAISRKAYLFLKNLLVFSRENNFKPTVSCVERLESLRIDTRELVAKQELGSVEGVLSEHIINQFDLFSKELDVFLKEIEIKNVTHPWEQFHVSSKGKKDEYFKFVKHMNAMDKVKRDTLKGGDSFGNVSRRAVKFMQQAEDDES